MDRLTESNSSKLKLSIYRIRISIWATLSLLFHMRMKLYKPCYWLKANSCLIIIIANWWLKKILITPNSIKYILWRKWIMKAKLLNRDRNWENLIKNLEISKGLWIKNFQIKLDSKNLNLSPKKFWKTLNQELEDTAHKEEAKENSKNSTIKCKIFKNKIQMLIWLNYLKMRKWKELGKKCIKELLLIIKNLNFWK